MIHLLSHALAAMLAASSAAGRPAPQVVIVHAKDFSYEAPKIIKANGPITFRLINDGKEMHHMTIVKVGAGKTMKDVAEAMKKEGPPPAWMTAVGGPNPALPGGTAEATLNLEPGLYAFMCFIPSPGSPMPHVAKGMIGSLTVESAGGAQQAGAPIGDITFHASDYKFAVSKAATPGAHEITFVNDGPQDHELVMMALAPGKTPADVSNWIEKDMMKGPPPGMPVGGMAGMAKGRSGSFPVTLKAGNYALICFVPDSKDGKPHSVHGMMQTLTVK